MGKFTELFVWQESKRLAVEIYKITNEGAIARDFGLRDQLRRAAVSVPSNIAEGDELDTNKQSVRHFYIAKGSAAEVYTQLLISIEIGYLDQESTHQLCEKYQALSRKLSNLIKARRLS